MACTTFIRSPGSFHHFALVLSEVSLHHRSRLTWYLGECSLIHHISVLRMIAGQNNTLQDTHYIFEGPRESTP
jgi:hypothetical protein